MTDEQMGLLYAVASAALAQARRESGAVLSVDEETAHVASALTWIKPFLGFQVPDETLADALDSAVNNSLPSGLPDVSGLLAALRAQQVATEGLIAEVTEAADLVTLLHGKLVTLRGTATLTNDNGIQVALVVSKGWWTSLERLLADDGDQEESGERALHLVKGD